jgi:transposase
MILEDAEVIYQRCAGFDVHKSSVKVCVRKISERGKLYREVRSYGTKTRELLALSDWLSSEGVTHIAMESTGVYWKPIWNLLEERFTILLVNAQHLKQVPGRKTDVKDCEWIAKCLQMGMVRGSFVPGQPLRELRDLTRHRTKLICHQTAVINRIHKTLEDCNIKLSSVATDIMGASGRDMIYAIANGENDASKLANLSRGRLRNKMSELEMALEGRITEHHRFMLMLLMRELKSLEDFVEEISLRIEKAIAPYHEEVELFETTTGVSRRTSENVVAECGVDMNQFPTFRHFTSWIGACPGNNESAGKHKSGRTKPGNRWAKNALIEASWAASRAKGSYFNAQYHRIAPRRGRKRAIGAVAHSLAVCYFHIIKRKVPFKDLGPDHFKRLNPAALRNYYIRKLQKLGYKVTLEAA